MKYALKQQWILSAVLIAALGSQYYFSASSKDAGQFDFSSRAPSEAPLAATTQLDTSAQVARLLEKLNSPITVSTVTNTTTASGVNNASAVINTTEAGSKEVPCDDCSVLSKTEKEIILKALKENIELKKAAVVVAAKPVETPLVVVTKVAEKEIVTVVETAADKREREKEEKAEAKRKVLQAKEDKKQADQDKIDDKFQTDFDKYSEKCEDANCYATQLAKAIKRNTSGSKKVSSELTKEIFNELIAKDLKIGLSDPENTKALSTLETLLGSLPPSQADLKKQTVNIAKSVVKEKADAIKLEVKKAEELRKAKKTTESLEVFQSASIHSDELRSQMNSQHGFIKAGTDSSGDSAMYSYYKREYMDEAKKWLAEMLTGYNPISQNNNSNTDVNGNTNNPSRGVVRGGNTTNNNNMSQPQQQNNGTQFGNAQPSSNRGRDAN